MHGEEYECVVAAIAMLDAATDALEAAQTDECKEETIELHHIRNRLNARRVQILGNGPNRPWHVSELCRQP